MTKLMDAIRNFANETNKDDFFFIKRQFRIVSLRFSQGLGEIPVILGYDALSGHFE